METITRNVSDIPAGDLPALERLIGASLKPDQQVVVDIIERQVSDGTDSESTVAGFPEWCNVYEGLSDAEFAVGHAVAYFGAETA